MKKIKIISGIIILILIVFLILLFNSDTRNMLYSSVKNILRIDEEGTAVDFEIKKITDTDVSILIDIQNQNGLEIVTTQEDDTLELNGRTALAIDRTVSRWSTYTLQIKARGESNATEYVLKIDQNAAVRSFIKEYKNQTQKNLEDFLDGKGAMLFEENENTYRVEYDYKVFTLDKTTLEITNESDLNEIILTAKTKVTLSNGKRKLDNIIGRIKSYGNITSLTVTTPSSTVKNVTPTSNFKYEYNTDTTGVHTVTAIDEYGNEKSVNIEIMDFTVIYDRISLENIKYDLSATYNIINDIDLSDKNYTSTVISGPFTGTLNGNGHAIKNLTKTLLDGRSCTVQNLKIENTKTNYVFTRSYPQSGSSRCYYRKVGITGTAPAGNAFGALGMCELDDCYVRVNYTSRGTWYNGIR